MDKSEFAEFMRAEYNNIAQAHFNINTAVGEFFKMYIAVVSLPVSLAVIFGKPAELRTSGMLDFLRDNAFAVAAALGLVWFVGLFVMGYLANLRCDALLYARTVNGIRAYFYARSGIGPARDRDIRVLPMDTRQPRYFEPQYFLFVVLAFAFVGTAYLLLAVYFYSLVNNWVHDARFWRNVVILATASFALHVGTYWLITRHREQIYLRP
jgi:hypothetical protein